jgi:hypothetical protein
MSILTRPLSIPEESATMPNKLEGMSTNINKTLLKLMLFLWNIENKGFAFLLVNDDD